MVPLDCTGHSPGMVRVLVSYTQVGSVFFLLGGNGIAL